MDSCAIDVPSAPSDYASDNQPHDNTNILQKRGAKDLSQDDGDEGQKSYAYKFG